MNLIIRPRQGGKTYEIIKEACKHQSYIVCINRIEVDRIFQEARQMKLEIPFPITWAEFVEKRYYGRGINSFMIDNLDLCIQQMTDVEIKTISINGMSNGK